MVPGDLHSTQPTWPVKRFTHQGGRGWRGTVCPRGTDSHTPLLRPRPAHREAAWAVSTQPGPRSEAFCTGKSATGVGDTCAGQRSELRNLPRGESHLRSLTREHSGMAAFQTVTPPRCRAAMPARGPVPTAQTQGVGAAGGTVFRARVRSLRVAAQASREEGGPRGCRLIFCCSWELAGWEEGASPPQGLEQRETGSSSRAPHSGTGCKRRPARKRH